MAATWVLSALYTSLLSSNSIPSSSGPTYVTVDTQHGTVRGQLDNSQSQPVAKFLGIPFAAPPVGPLRFQPPALPSNWTGVKDALTFGHECIQVYYPQYDNGHDQSEDCLYLNVYTPVTSRAASDAASGGLPVMVWIHGGGYIAGAASHYDLTGLAPNGVVAVSVNYRLNHFGFLSTEDDVIPGNYGMLDQIRALQWVNGNIRNFGGDPNQVTIFGQSAGGGSVALLQLSPLAKNLFHQVISQSGNSMSTWSYVHAGNRISPKTLARLVGSKLDCDDIKNSTSLLACFQSVDAKTFFNISHTIITAVDSNNGVGVLAPRVETTFGFLPDLPINLLTKGLYNKVDRISGYNSDELESIMYMFVQANLSTADVIEKSLTYSVSQFTELAQGQMKTAIRSAFMTGAGLEHGGLRGALTAMDALGFKSATLAEIALLSRDPHNHVFMYEFQYTPPYNTPRLPWTAAQHGWEVGYVLNISVPQLYTPKHKNVTPEMQSVSDQMIGMWTNFAKTGNPSLITEGFTWEQYASTSPRYMFMGTKAEMRTLGRPNAIEDFFKVMLLQMDGITRDSNQLDVIVG